MASQIEALIRRRTEARKMRALRHALVASQNLAEHGVRAEVIGSLASGEFMSHSDVDYLVFGHIETMKRRLVDSAIAKAMNGSEVGYDTVCAEDIQADMVGSFFNVRADTSRLLELAHEDHTA